MKIYLINLERSADRREYMLSELARLVPGISIKRAMCVDVKSNNWKPPEGVTAGRWQSDRWDLTPSNIEVFRSHMDCWQQIESSGAPGIVLEDDVLFSQHFPEIVKSLKSKHFSGLLKLDGVAKPLLLEPAAKNLEQFRVFRLRSNVGSAAAYYLDPMTAGNLVEQATINRHVDDYLFDPSPSERRATGHDQPIFQIEPIVAVQARFGDFSSPDRKTPEFLQEAKRVDKSKDRSRVYTGPLTYRLRKEATRILSKRRLAKKTAELVKTGAKFEIPELSEDLKWH